MSVQLGDNVRKLCLVVFFRRTKEQKTMFGCVFPRTLKASHSESSALSLGRETVLITANNGCQ